MAQHNIRGIDAGLWRRFKVRAASDGLTLKDAMLLLMEMYADGLRLKKKAEAK